jgi:hypothetical protein
MLTSSEQIKDGKMDNEQQENKKKMTNARRPDDPDLQPTYISPGRGIIHNFIHLLRPLTAGENHEII